MIDFKKYFIIPAPPTDVYNAITNPIALAMWTYEEAIMSEEINSEFSLWGGNICGKNLEFVKNSKVVQQWYFGDNTPPSIVTFKFHAHKKGTSLEVHQTNIPENDYTDFEKGWNEMYIADLIEFFED